MKNQNIIYGVIAALALYILFTRYEKYTEEKISPSDDVFEIVRKIEEAKKAKNKPQ
jgi:hypothetical protein|uniref:Uncharacterized protein n=1 Tax=viral metagenome TaxID=1070528 RepID=A0A6C0JFM0_9ZZZZ